MRISNKIKTLLALTLCIISVNGVAYANEGEKSITEMTYEEKVDLLNSYSLDFIENNVEDIEILVESIEKDEMEKPELLAEANPYNMNDYYDYYGKITRDGMLSFSIDPKNTVRTSKSKASTAYSAFYAKYRNDADFKKGPTSTENQYWCHFNYAKYKDRWNLEPVRPVVSNTQMIAKLCNP